MINTNSKFKIYNNTSDNEEDGENKEDEYNTGGNSQGKNINNNNKNIKEQTDNKNDNKDKKNENSNKMEIKENDYNINKK